MPLNKQTEISLEAINCPKTLWNILDLKNISLIAWKLNLPLHLENGNWAAHAALMGKFYFLIFLQQVQK